MKNIRKKENGITLVALVVTIIILIILASITIGTITGENGLFKRAKDTAKKYEDSATKEENDLTHLGELLNSHKYEPIVETYTIIYNANGGANGPDKQIKKHGETIKITDEVPNKLNSVFCGWSISKENADQGSIDYRIGTEFNLNNDITLYAVWEQMKVSDTINYNYDKVDEPYDLPGNITGAGTYTSSTPIKMVTPLDTNISQDWGENQLTWKILNIDDDGNIEIISENPTNGALCIKGATGYNNGVFLLDDICEKFYSNKKLNVTARNLKITDIEKNMSTTGTNAKKTYSYNGVGVGITKKWTSERYYPKLYTYQNGTAVNSNTLNTSGISESDSGIKYGVPMKYDKNNNEGYLQASSSLTVTTTAYLIDSKEDYYNNSSFFKLVFSTGHDYWISSRTLFPSPYHIYFCIWSIIDNKLSDHTLFEGNTNIASGTDQDNQYSLRPIVTLNNNIKYVKESDGSISLKT